MEQEKTEHQDEEPNNNSTKKKHGQKRNPNPPELVESKLDSQLLTFCSVVFLDSSTQVEILRTSIIDALALARFFWREFQPCGVSFFFHH